MNLPSNAPKALRELETDSLKKYVQLCDIKF